MSILSYNGAAIIAMAGKDCIGIACDTRLGIQGQTVATDFQKVFRVTDKCFLGLAGLATDVQTVSQLLKFKVNMYKMSEERELKPKTLSALLSSMMYEKRFGPWFVEPVIAGLTEDNKPFLSSMDCLGCEMMTKDFVVAGTMEEALYGMCESLYRPDMEADDLFETLSQCLLSACNRDAMSGWGGVVHIIDHDAGERLPWGMEKKEMQPSSLKALTDDKLARFVIGTQKKTRFEREKEEREAKKRRADSEAAAIYATFVASFEDDDNDQGKTFVRGETIRHESSEARNGHGGGESGAVYRLQSHSSHSSRQALTNKTSEMDRMLEEMKRRDNHSTVAPAGASTAGKKKREIDAFLEEMKQRGGDSSSSGGRHAPTGSFDDGDPETTNLYVGNLAASVTEEVLHRQFSRFGRVYSVKIMWPRSEEERLRKRHCGFVSFFERRDADEARINLNEKELEGLPMVVGWGKAVKIEPSLKQIQVQLPAEDATRQRIDRLARTVSTDGNQYEQMMMQREADNKDYEFLRDRSSALGIYYRWRVYAYAMGDSDTSWSEMPFMMTQSKQEQKPKLKSLTRISSKIAISPLVTLIQPMNETGRKIVSVTQEAEAVADSRTRRSPSDGLHGTKQLMTGQQLANARDKERGRERNRLPKEEYEIFQQLLRDLTVERESVKRTMGFVLDNSEAAVDLVHIMLKAFRNDEATPVSKIAYLFVASDILHNSSASVKNASLFRTTFQEVLPEIVDQLRQVHKAIQGRMSANAMKDKVLSVLTAWESWSLFPPLYMVGLNATFMRKVEEADYEALHPITVPEGVDEEVLRKKCRQAGIMATGTSTQLLARLQWLNEFTSPTTAPTAVATSAPAAAVSRHCPPQPPTTTSKATSEAIKNSPLVHDVDGQPLDEEDIDGSPVDSDVDGSKHRNSGKDDVDGAPLDEDVDGEPLDDDVDGEPLDDPVEDVDGEPLDEDLDGEPMDEEDLDGEPL
ncbi:TPA: hypothetical protein N0F65_010264 [Lagenidium giganteum]|uniref:Uncharacterized protein n=1 Tax=Lagenidium giganteum TaxID=4803 RepID=A0AAV2YMB2_9STRA|nr:TPA: hypothetical protein N0F65_010264 [Lagenidium giganteum]